VECGTSGVKQIEVPRARPGSGLSLLRLSVDLDESRVLFATEGRGSETFGAFKQDVEAHEGDPAHVMWAVTISIVGLALPRMNTFGPCGGMVQRFRHANGLNLPVLRCSPDVTDVDCLPALVSRFPRKVMCDRR
jgi:hypothetical protein